MIALKRDVYIQGKIIEKVIYTRLNNSLEEDNPITKTPTVCVTVAVRREDL